MKTTVKPLAKRDAWKALASHSKHIKTLHLRQLFADDPERGARIATLLPGVSAIPSPHAVEIGGAAQQISRLW